VQYPFIITRLTKEESASLSKKTKPTKDQLLATITSKSMISEDQANRNPKIDKNVPTVRKTMTLPEPVLDITARRARDE
jgi:hypothetical protein